MTLQDFLSPELIGRISPVLLGRANDVLGVIATNQSASSPDVAEEAVLSCLLGVLHDSGCLDEGVASLVASASMPTFAENLKRLAQQVQSGLTLADRLLDAGFPDRLVTAARWSEGRFRNGAPLIYSAALLQLIQASESPLVPVDESISLDFGDDDDGEVSPSEPVAPYVKVLDMLEYAKAVYDHVGLQESLSTRQIAAFLESENALLKCFVSANDEGKDNIAIGLFLLRLGFLLRVGVPILVSILLVNERTKLESASFGEVICAITASLVSCGDSLSNALGEASIPEDLCRKIAVAEEDGSLDEVLSHLGTSLA